MRRVKEIKQHDATDCAAAALAAVACSWGLEVPLIKIREACGSGRNGTTIKGLADGARRLGLNAKALKSPQRAIEALSLIEYPAILHIEKENGDLHFVVFCGEVKGGFTVMDPAEGKRVVWSRERMKRLWTGYLVLFSPDATFIPGKHTVSLWERLRMLIRPVRAEMALAILSAFVYIAAGISTSLFLQQLIDKIIPVHDTAMLVRVIAAMVVLAILSLLVAYLRGVLMIQTGLKTDCSLIVKYIRHLFSLKPGFFSSHGSGELNSRIGDAMRIRTFLTQDLASLTVGIMTLVVSFALMFTYHWKLALFTLMFLPAYLAVYVVSGKVGVKLNRAIIEQSARFEEVCVESISAAETIKYTGSEESVTYAMEREYSLLAGKIMGGGSRFARLETLSEGISKMLVVFLFAVGSYFIFKGELTVGELVSFYSVTAFFSGPLSTITEVIRNMSETKVSAQRLFEIMDMEGECSEGLDMDLEGESTILFHDVSFSYPGGLPVFEHLNLSFSTGEIVAVTGESGCGKSTIASLLLRGCTPDSGSITVKGVELSLLKSDRWREFTAIVPQDAILLNRSILDNIAMGDSDPDIEQVVRLLDRLGLGEFITRLPMGILTRCGEKGCRLSGGQRQRIALARALYRNPSFLILDEATASLDAESEKIVLDYLTELKNNGMGIIMITHRQGNVSIADREIKLTAQSAGFAARPKDAET